MTTQAAFLAHVKEVERRALAGDEHAVRTLAALALLLDGWRPSDPDGGGEVVELWAWRQKRAA